MPTNEERREVARNIRNADLTKHASYYEEVKGWDHVRATRFVLVSNLGSAIGIDKAIFSIDDLKIRLADLIEPEQERTCSNVETPAGVDVDPEFFRCSKCGCEVMLRTGRWVALYGGKMNYCPNCGAKVVENEVTPTSL